MAQLLSPGVYIEEVDASSIVPNVAANIAFLAGNFTKGPQDLPYVVTNKQEYESIFGTPTNENYNEWFLGYKFFDYANQLVVTRGFNQRPETLTIVDPETPKRNIFSYIGTPTISNSIIEVVELEGGFYGKVTPEVDYDTTKIVQVYRKEPVDSSYAEGDVLYLGTVQAKGKIIQNGIFHVNPDDPQTPVNPSDPVAIAAPIGTNAMLLVELENDEVNLITESSGKIYINKEVQTGLSVIFDVYQNDFNTLKKDDFFAFENYAEVFKTYSITPYSDIDTSDPLNPRTVQKLKITGIYQGSTDLSTFNPIPNGKLYILAEDHLNGGAEAYQRYYDGNEVNTALPAFNIDATQSDEINPRRLNYSYHLIKNDPDFEFQKEQNPDLISFLDGFKLKFLSKTATTEKIEIAIANPDDFESVTNDHSNYAVAFTEGSGTSVKNIMLTSLYDYYPVGNQFAIMVKAGNDIESFIVSFDKEALDGNGKSLYVETVINEQSKHVYVINNDGLSIDKGVATYLVQDKYGNPTLPGAKLTQVLTVQGGRNPALDKSGLKDAYFSVVDKEKYEIDVVIGNEKYPNIAIELADTRKDCIAYIGARFEDTVGKKAVDATNAIVSTILNTGTAEQEPITRTMFAAYFGNYFRIYDKYNKTYRWINVAGDMAGIRCDVTSNTAPWWVSAGMSRGIIRNVNKIAFTPSQEQRDLLYKNGVNPIVAFPGTGNLVWGNKTLHPVASSFDRINVRTLFNTLERSMAKAARSQVFEFNDPYTRNAVQSMFNPYLATIKAGRGITDYLVICDETNNTPDVISRNELRVDIYIKPNYAAEMILLTFTNVGTRSFADVIGV